MSTEGKSLGYRSKIGNTMKMLCSYPSPSIYFIARQSGIDIELNDESKRETLAVVFFGDKQRFFGTSGDASTMMNLQETLACCQSPDRELQIVAAFVDINGHASMKVCVAPYKKGELKIVAHSFDRSLGGRDFGEVLFQHFVAIFKIGYKIYVFQNPRACLGHRAACEKLKKVDSTNPECLMDEKKARALIKMEEFEQISVPILKRVKRPLEKVHSEAGLTYENIHTQHWRPLNFNKARFVHLILFLLLQSTQVEARGDRSDSYLIFMGIAILVAIVIIILIAGLCYCIRLFIGEPPPEAEVELAKVQRGYLDTDTFQTIFLEVPLQEGEDDEICAICKENYNNGVILRGFPKCLHKYHHPCIESWLIATGKTSCPICRYDYRDRSVCANPFPV